MKQHKILILGKIEQAALQLLKKNKSFEVIQLLGLNASNEKKISNNLKNVTALLVRTQKIKAEWIATAKNLKIISRHGVGIDNLPLEIIKKKKIALFTVQNVSAIAVAEHTIMLLLTCAKQFYKYRQAITKNNWTIRDSGQATELYKKKLLLIGCGKVGKQILNRLIAFKMKFLVFDPYVSTEKLKKFSAKKISNLNTGLKTADFIVLACPKTQETINIIDEKQIALMKKSAILINCARGGLVNEAALTKALGQNQLAAAGLDVFVPRASTSK